jgi:hypothetical protein
MTHWRQKPKTGKRSFAERLSEREARRTSAISAAVSELSRIGDGTVVDHDLVAERTGIPVQHLLWKYPTIDCLRRMQDVA